MLREHDELRHGCHHALYQPAVYEEIPGPVRTDLHRRAITVLRVLPSPPLVKVAHHARAAGDSDTWLRFAKAAADQAGAVGDDGTAATLLNDILQHPRLDSQDRARSAVALSRSVVERIDYRRSIATLKTAPPPWHATRCSAPSADVVASASPESLRAMVKTFAEAMTSADVDRACGGFCGRCSARRRPGGPRDGPGPARRARRGRGGSRSPGRAGRKPSRTRP
ncbi:hypothetical protein GCM10009665_10480 [Kitasatospora nipponensis]|uniref:Uncharacterized protein n=1 Tax=Kitasatospora nipponensis TaxID=258049 RepID=A0ABN1VWW5_9ACTN